MSHDPIVPPPGGPTIRRELRVTAREDALARALARYRHWRATGELTDSRQLASAAAEIRLRAISSMDDALPLLLERELDLPTELRAELEAFLA